MPCGGQHDRMPQRLALNVELTPSAEGGAPEWVEMIPTGPDVNGLDGRRWVYDAQSEKDVLQAFAQRGMDIQIDWEHASEHRAPQGLAAPAAGWSGQLEPRNGALWGRVQWTPRAAQQIANREYRFLSPVFEYDPATRRITRLVSVGLTNTPNLPLTALNREETPVTLPVQIAEALGLKPDATEEAAVAAIAQIKTTKAANAEQPSLEKFVPRADFDQLMTRATNAEQQLVDRDQADHKAAVDVAIGAALKAGKIAPSSEEYYRASCAEAEGLTRFKKFVEGAPVIGDASGLDGRRADDGKGAKALNAEEQAVAKAFGMSAEDFAQAKAAE